MNNNYVVEIKNLTKQYGKFTALDNMNLQIEPNKIYGLLGRNGAGKTTMLNILTSRIFPTSGKATIWGQNAYENIETLKKLCFIEEKGFYASNYKVRQMLELAKGIYPNWDENFANELIKLFELDPNKKYRQLSRGMESSLGLILGLASRAEITIFDEPTLGLDAVIRERFYDVLIDDFEMHPRTIIISTHLIEEVSKLFEDIIIIESGKILLKSNTAELKEKAFYLSGKTQQIKDYLSSTNAVILNEEHLGSSATFAVYSQQPIYNSSDTQIEIESIPMQKLFVLLINKKTSLNFMTDITEVLKNEN